MLLYLFPSIILGFIPIYCVLRYIPYFKVVIKKKRLTNQRVSIKKPSTINYWIISICSALVLFLMNLIIVKVGLSFTTSMLVGFIVSIFTIVILSTLYLFDFLEEDKEKWKKSYMKSITLNEIFGDQTSFYTQRMFEGSLKRLRISKNELILNDSCISELKEINDKMNLWAELSTEIALLPGDLSIEEKEKLKPIYNQIQTLEHDLKSLDDLILKSLKRADIPKGRTLSEHNRVQKLIFRVNAEEAGVSHSVKDVLTIVNDDTYSLEVRDEAKALHEELVVKEIQQGKGARKNDEDAKILLDFIRSYNGLEK